MDNTEELYLNNQSQAMVESNSIVIIQNKQLLLSSALSCAYSNTNIMLSGRNPIVASLLAFAELIGGLPASQFGHKGIITTSQNINELSHNSIESNDFMKIDDYSLCLGTSPRFQASINDIPTFNQIDIVSSLSHLRLI